MSGATENGHVIFLRMMRRTVPQNRRKPNDQHTVAGSGGLPDYIGNPAKIFLKSGNRFCRPDLRENGGDQWLAVF